MSDRKGGFFKGAIVGGLIAGTAALLFAPKAGKELRADIAKKAGDVSDELDKKLQQAKKNSEKLSGDAKRKQMELIEKAEFIRAKLIERSNALSKSGKKVTKVAVRETQKLIDQGKELATQLDQYKSSAAKDASKFVKKATVSAGKVMQAASKELNKDTKPTKTPAKSTKKK